LDRSTIATVRYLEPLAERPYIYCYDPPPGVSLSNYKRDERIVKIEDARCYSTKLTWDEHGLEMINLPFRADSFSGHEAIRASWYPAACELVRGVTGAAEAVVFDHTFRKNIRAQDSTPDCRPPVMQVHVDGVDRIAVNFVRQYYAEQADRWLNGRWQIVNVWRPVANPVVDAPLAFCDGRFVDPGDLIPTDLYFPDGRVGLTYQVLYRPNHCWRYIPEMSPDEVVLFKCFDTHVEAPVRFVPHSAFHHPDTPPNAEPRQSVELRIFAFLGD
jgi:hypothetical protein